ncbi:hypothetical protein ACLOJK_035858 [Asimina triloba]
MLTSKQQAAVQIVGHVSIESLSQTERGARQNVRGPEGIQNRGTTNKTITHETNTLTLQKVLLITQKSVQKTKREMGVWEKRTREAPLQRKVHVFRFSSKEKV